MDRWTDGHTHRWTGGQAGRQAEWYLWEVGYRAQVKGLEDVEEASDDLGVVTAHGWVSQVAHEGIDGHRGVVILAASHKACCWQEVPSILGVSSYGT